MRSTDKPRSIINRQRSSAKFNKGRDIPLLSEEPLKTELSYKAEVFSLNTRDTFLSYLQSLADNTPLDVREAANDVYGVSTRDAK